MSNKNGLEFWGHSFSLNTLTTVYTVPAATVAYVNFNIVNTNATPVSVRVALATGTPTGAEYIEYNAEIAGYFILRTGIALQATKNLVVLSDTANVSVSAYGFEEEA